MLSACLSDLSSGTFVLNTDLVEVNVDLAVSRVLHNLGVQVAADHTMSQTINRPNRSVQ